MGCIVYTAKNRGRLVSGHSAETEYTVECHFNVADEVDKREEYSAKSMAGYKYTQLVRIDSLLELATIWVDGDARRNLLEFLTSVSGGETFTVDPYGTAASPVETYTCTLVGDYKIDRHSTLPLFRVKFTADFSPAATVLD